MIRPRSNLLGLRWLWRDPFRSVKESHQSGVRGWCFFVLAAWSWWFSRSVETCDESNGLVLRAVLAPGTGAMNTEQH